MSKQGEQLVGSLFFLLFVVVGWGPYLFATATSGIYLAPVVLLGGFFALCAAGFVYDAAERLFGTGKGIYAAAIFVSFPSAAIIFSEPPFIAETSVMFVTAANVWFAARATEEQSREAMFFMAILSAVPLAVFGLWPPAFLPLLSLFILRKQTNASARALLITVGIAFLGLTAKSLLQFDLPEIMEQQPDLALTLKESAFLAAPWIGFIIAALFVKTAWARGVVICAAVLTLLHVLLDGEWVGLVGAASPLLALSVTAVILRWFHAQSEAGLRAVRYSALPLVLALVGLFVVRVTEPDVILDSRNHVIVGLVIATLLIVSAVKDGRRWMFALHVVAGLHIGVLWWYFWPENIDPAILESTVDLLPFLIAAGVIARGVVAWIYGRRMPRHLRQEGARHRFEEAVFRKFSNVRRKSWEGEPVSVTPADAGSVRFAIFGDVTGSESPFASRKTGYYAFQKIIEAIAARRPDFTVSTGDLATGATQLAYRRVRVLLRKLPFPIVVTPGNHDVVHYNKVHAQFFHALFGSDHGDITVGQVRLILINNALGTIMDEQWKWLDQTFAKPSEAEFTLVFCHKPVFDPREDAFYGMEVRSHAERLHELFKKHSVSAVFSGHIHSLLHLEKDGVTYVISGGGGSKLKSAEDTHHYLWCVATTSGVTVTAYGIESSEPLLTLNLSKAS